MTLRSITKYICITLTLLVMVASCNRSATKVEESAILSLEPTLFWKNFYEISQVPRSSNNEEHISAYLQNFAHSLKLPTIVDEGGNILIRKPATAGMENRKGVILQAHMDMVPNKEYDIEHDFTKDPLEPFIEGNWVRAKGTTLGADNGMGLAIALSVLEDTEIQHGPLEVLFTSNEEVGMLGARELNQNILQGEILINIDSEEDGELFIGCSGAARADFFLDYTTDPVPDDMEAFHIQIHGLLGGHSGIDIHLGRGNGIKILARLLLPLIDDYGVRVATMEGGVAGNVIPQDASAVICIPKENIDTCKNLLDNEITKLIDEFKGNDPDLEIDIQPYHLPETVLDTTSTLNVLNAINKVFDGVKSMSKIVENQMESSSNIGVLEINEKQIHIHHMIRSIHDADKAQIASDICDVYKYIGAEINVDDNYKAWTPNLESQILQNMSNIYKQLFGKEPILNTTPGGLECGIIKEKYPDMDIISVGANIMYAHTPNEAINIKSVQRLYDLIITTLKEIPVKE